MGSGRGEGAIGAGSSSTGQRPGVCEACKQLMGKKKEGEVSGREGRGEGLAGNWMMREVGVADFNVNVVCRQNHRTVWVVTYQPLPPPNHHPFPNQPPLSILPSLPSFLLLVIISWPSLTTTHLPPYVIHHHRSPSSYVMTTTTTFPPPPSSSLFLLDVISIATPVAYAGPSQS